MGKRFRITAAHVERTLGILRTVSAVLAALAVALWTLWFLMPERINALDAWLVKSYTEHYEGRLREAQELRATDPDGGLAMIEALFHDLRDIKSLDRLGRLKRKVFIELIQEYASRRMFDRASELTALWMEFDPRDLTATVSSAKVLYGMPGRREDGLELIRRLNERYSDQPMVRESYEGIMAVEAGRGGQR